MGEIQERLERCLSGKLPYSELGRFEQSAISIHVYFRAREILELPPDLRKEAAMQLPEDIRDLVREECKRLLTHRRLEQSNISQG